MGQQYSHLSSEERILIEKLHCEQHLSIRRTAERIGRDKSTVVLLQCLFDRFGSVFPQCGLMVFPGVVIVSR